MSFSSLAFARQSRILLSSHKPCIRNFASSAPSLLSENDTAKSKYLLNLMEAATAEAEARKRISLKDRNVLKLPDASMIPPYEFNREHQNRTTYRGRAPLGPGRRARYDDIFLQHGIDPRREAHNEALMSYFMTRLGKIKPRSVTGLSQRSQRLVGKAIKRAKMMGVVPIFSNSKLGEIRGFSDPNALAQNVDEEPAKDESTEDENGDSTSTPPPVN